MIPEPECYKCHSNEGLLAPVYAPGTYYMCGKCIREEEDKTGKTAVFSYLNGLRFLTKKEHDNYLDNKWNQTK
jgi:hypothetical protein